MERLAAQGVKFTSAYACSVCTPTRVSLNTGFNAARHKVTNWTATSANTETSGQTSTLRAPSQWRWNGLEPSGTTYSRVFTNDNTLPRLLKEAGYRTIHCGKAHFGSSPTPGSNPVNLGFDVNIAGSEIGNPASYYGTNNFGSGTHHVPGLDQYHGSNIFLSEALTVEANKAVTQAVADQQPFYLYMAHYAVHTPIQVDPRFSANYPALDATERAYATLVEGMDKSLGDILDQLQRLGIAQDTIVVFYSDNGGLSAGARGASPYGGVNTHNFPLRAGKGSCYEGGIREPAIFAWAKPDATNAFQQTFPIAPNSACARPIIVEDLFPTVLHWAGVSPPAGIDGLDITGYVTAQPGFSRPEKFLWHYPHVWSAGYLAQNQGYEPHSVWREGDWKVIYFYNPNRWELYNVAADIRETNNLAVAQPNRLMNLARTMARELAARGALFPELITTGASVAPVMPNLPAVDTDADGLPDLDEDSNRNGLVDPGETDPAKTDTDGDDTPDGAEVRLGTDPLNAVSCFTLSASVSNGSLLLAWPSRTGTMFRIEEATNISPASWAVAADDVPGQNSSTTNSLSLPPGSPSAFYRVLLK
jgi:arylsulfatase A-like enzyme